MEGEPVGDRACLEHSAGAPAPGVRHLRLPPKPGEHSGCGPGAALKAEDTERCEVRLLCSPPPGRRTGRGPGLLRTQCERQKRLGFETSVFRHDRMEAESAAVPSPVATRCVPSGMVFDSP